MDEGEKGLCRRYDKHLIENNITLKAYVTELLEADLVKDKELNKQEEKIERETKSNTLEEQKVESKEETKPARKHTAILIGVLTRKVFILGSLRV